MGVFHNPKLKWTFVMPTKRAKTSGADTKPRPSVSVPVITESWQVQWSDSKCKQFLRKSSDLWKELGPIVFALSAHLPTAAKYLWDELSDPPPEGQEDKDEDL